MEFVKREVACIPAKQFGYSHIRCPSIRRAQNGWSIYAEGRKSKADSGPIDLVNIDVADTGEARVARVIQYEGTSVMNPVDTSAGVLYTTSAESIDEFQAFRDEKRGWRQYHWMSFAEGTQQRKDFHDPDAIWFAFGPGKSAMGQYREVVCAVVAHESRPFDFSASIPEKIGKLGPCYRTRLLSLHEGEWQTFWEGPPHSNEASVIADGNEFLVCARMCGHEHTKMFYRVSSRGETVEEWPADYTCPSVQSGIAKFGGYYWTAAPSRARRRFDPVIHRSVDAHAWEPFDKIEGHTGYSALDADDERLGVLLEWDGYTALRLFEVTA